MRCRTPLSMSLTTLAPLWLLVVDFTLAPLWLREVDSLYVDDTCHMQRKLENCSIWRRVFGLRTLRISWMAASVFGLCFSVLWTDLALLSLQQTPFSRMGGNSSLPFAAYHLGRNAEHQPEAAPAPCQRRPCPAADSANPQVPAPHDWVVCTQRPCGPRCILGHQQWPVHSPAVVHQAAVQG